MIQLRQDEDKLSMSSLTVIWNELATVDHYVVRLIPQREGDEQQRVALTCCNSITFDGLKAGRFYSIIVHGVIAFAQIQSSQLHVFSTECDNSFVTAVREVSANEVEFMWSDARDADSYRIVFRDCNSGGYDLIFVDARRPCTYNHSQHNCVYIDVIPIYDKFNGLNQGFAYSQDSRSPVISGVEVGQDLIVVYWISPQAVTIPSSRFLCHIWCESYWKGYPVKQTVREYITESPVTFNQINTHYAVCYVDVYDKNFCLASDTFVIYTAPPKAVTSIVAEFTSSDSLVVQWQATLAEYFFVELLFPNSSDSLHYTTYFKNVTINVYFFPGERYDITVRGINKAGQGDIASSFVIGGSLGSTNVSTETTSTPSLNCDFIETTTSQITTSPLTTTVNYNITAQPSVTTPTNNQSTATETSISITAQPHDTTTSQNTISLFTSTENSSVAINQLITTEEPTSTSDLSTATNTSITNTDQKTTTDSSTTDSSTTTEIQPSCINVTCATNAKCFEMDENRTECVCNHGFMGNGSISCTGFCEEATLKGLTFPDTFEGFMAYSIDICDSGRSIGSVYCTSFLNETNEKIVEFDLQTFVAVNCNQTVADSIEQVDTSSTEEVQTAFADIQILTSEPEAMTNDDAMKIVNFYGDVAENSTEVSESCFQDVVYVTSHMSMFYDQGNVDEPSRSNQDNTQANDKQNLLENLSIIARKVNLTAVNKTLFTEKSQNLFSQIIDMTNASVEDNVTFFPEFYTLGNNSYTFVPVSFTLPGQVFQAAENETRTIRIVFFTHRTSILFPSSQTADWVISTEIGNNTFESLEVPLQYSQLDLNPPEKKIIDEFKINMSELRCVFWDFTDYRWVLDGCCLIPDDPPRCECNHLTNFGVLVSNVISPTSFVLDVVGNVGCYLSIIGLVLTFLVIVTIKKLFIRRPMQVILHLCANLTISYLLFALGIDKTWNNSMCTAVAALLQYFFLCSWCFMSIYSHLLYRMVVKTMSTLGSNYNMYYACMFGYGFPLVIVSLNVGITLGHIDEKNAEPGPVYCNQSDAPDPIFNSSYRASYVCWLHDYSLYLGFVLPICLHLCYNIICFIAVLRQLLTSGAIQSNLRRHNIRHHLMTSIVMATMMGFSWITGIAVIFADNTTTYRVASWLFTLFNAFQGFFIFAVTCIRGKEVRKATVDQLTKTWKSIKSSYGSRSNGTASQQKQMSLGLSDVSPKKENVIALKYTVCEK